MWDKRRAIMLRAQYAGAAGPWPPRRTLGITRFRTWHRCPSVAGGLGFIPLAAPPWEPCTTPSMLPLPRSWMAAALAQPPPSW